jgi:hypothetical protein
MTEETDEAIRRANALRVLRKHISRMPTYVCRDGIDKMFYEAMHECIHRRLNELVMFEVEDKLMCGLFISELSAMMSLLHSCFYNVFTSRIDFMQSVEDFRKENDCRK